MRRERFERRRRLQAILSRLGYVEFRPPREFWPLFRLIRLQRARRAFVDLLARRVGPLCQCGERLPAKLVHWPGGDVRLCVRCTFRASHIAKAMGFALSVQELPS